jgi:hypothetical protein
VAVAIPGTLPLAAGVAVTAQELADLGLQGGLHDQPHAQPGNLLQDLPEVLLRANSSSIWARMRSVADSLGGTGVVLLSLSW